MEESCLFLLCVRSTQTFFIISPLYRFQQAFFDKESVFPPHFMPDPAKKIPPCLSVQSGIFIIVIWTS